MAGREKCERNLIALPCASVARSSFPSPTVVIKITVKNDILFLENL